MTDLKQEFLFALRTHLKNRSFALVVLLTLAMGIGVNTAIFTLMDQVLLKRLPVTEPERLVVLSGPGPFSGSTHTNSSPAKGQGPASTRSIGRSLRRISIIS